MKIHSTSQQIKYWVILTLVLSAMVVFVVQTYLMIGFYKHVITERFDVSAQAISDSFETFYKDLSVLSQHYSEMADEIAKQIRFDDDRISMIAPYETSLPYQVRLIKDQSVVSSLLANEQYRHEKVLSSDYYGAEDRHEKVKAHLAWLSDQKDFPVHYPIVDDWVANQQFYYYVSLPQGQLEIVFDISNQVSFLNLQNYQFPDKAHITEVVQSVILTDAYQTQLYHWQAPRNQTIPFNWLPKNPEFEKTLTTHNGDSVRLEVSRGNDGLVNRVRIFMLITLVLTGVLTFWIIRVALKFIGPFQDQFSRLFYGVKALTAGEFQEPLTFEGVKELSVIADHLEDVRLQINRLLSERYAKENTYNASYHMIMQQTTKIKALNDDAERLGYELEQILAKNENNYFGTLSALANAIEAKDHYTRGHCDRVMDLSLRIGQKLRLGSEDIRALKYGAILHDIGKIGTHEAVLNKPMRLTDQEYRLIKQHPMTGYDIVKHIGFLKKAQEIILYHHERYDGGGYPFGKAGEDIPYLARLVCIVDAYDSMTSSRPYRQTPMIKERAIEELMRCKGTQFDADLVEVFVKILEENDDL